MMMRETEPFLRRTADFSRLEPFGFVRAADGWHYCEPFLDSAFSAKIRIDPDGAVFGTVIDNDLGEEFLPIRTEREVGAYVGAVREGYAAVLKRIADACFVPEAFLFPQTNRIAKALFARYGERPDHPFLKLPSAAVFRFPETRKWYGLVMTLPRATVTGEPAEDSPTVEVLNCKIDPVREPELLRQNGIFPGYHMKRPDWISIVLDGSVPDELVLDLLAASRVFAMRGAKYKTRTAPVEWIVPANPRYYDVDAAFLRENVIFWKQSSDVHVGDTVYLYVAAPVSAVRYRCTAVEVDLPYPYRDKNVSMKKVMRIRREQTYPPEAVPFSKLCALGIRAVRGPREVTAAFSAYMKTL